MRILQVASFQGNVGDNANHNGLRSQLSRILPEAPHYDELEIRRFYQKYDGVDRLRFDEHFVRLANEYDVVIFGGGNFFEIWLENSSTGCTIDIPPHILDQLKAKLVFFGLGFDTYKGSTAATRARFLDFLKRLLGDKNCLVTVRNDGSVQQLTDCYGLAVAEAVRKVPDGGFFLQIPDAPTSLVKPDRFNIVFSIAEDMMPVRFPQVDPEQAQRQMVSGFVDLMMGIREERKDAHFILMPHIYSDLGVMSEVLKALPDHVRRNSVTVGPCISGTGSEAIVFSTYRLADFVASMRFHGNVVPIGLNVPTMGIGTYKKIADLYRELGHMERVVQLAPGANSIALLDQFHKLMAKSQEIRTENTSLMKRLSEMMNRFLAALEELLRS